MPLILQAANQGWPVIDIHIPPHYMDRWLLWVQTLSSHPDFLQLGQIFALSDSPFHLSAQDQNTIINTASPLLGQEIQEFIA